MDPILLEIPHAFQTERLSMRSYVPGDGSMYCQAIQENRDHLFEYLPDIQGSMRDEKDAQAFFRWLEAEWQQRSIFLFGIWEKQTGAYVGETYLANADWKVPCIELGYFILKSYTGRGFAAEAARGMIQFAFDSLQVARIELQVSADNQVSQRVAERCGFQLEGRLRQRNRKKAGPIVDRLWYGLLLEERPPSENKPAP